MYFILYASITVDTTRNLTETLPYFDLLDRYTKASVYVIHSSFSLAELLTFTSFQLASSTIKFSLDTAEECVLVMDGLFGDTETSKALAAFIHLWYDLLKGRCEEMGYSKGILGQMYIAGHIAKSMTVGVCY